MTLAGSKLQRLPRPWHVSQAPNGLLKENDRGSSCGTLAPQSGTGQLLRIQLVSGAVHHRDQHQSVGQLGRGVDGRFQALFDLGLDQQPVDHHFDGVILAPVERDLLVERPQHAVDRARARIPGARASPAPSCIRLCARGRSAPGSSRAPSVRAPAPVPGSARWSGAKFRGRNWGNAARRWRNTARADNRRFR